MPDGVVGQMQKDAETALTKAGLKVEYAPQVYDDNAGLGVVIGAVLPDGSDAEAGAQAVRGDTVKLTVSKGPAPVKVTSVVGATLEEATDELDKIGLKVTSSEAYSDTVKAGVIISQDPVSGADAHRGDTVTLVVSKGPELVTMPNVFQMGYDEAKKKLEALGLKVDRKDSWGGFIGTVVDQSVPADTQVPKGTTVTLTVV